MNYRTLGAIGYLGEGVLLVGAGLIFAFGQFSSTPVQTSQTSGVGSFPFGVISEVLALIPLAIVSLAWFSAGRQKSSGILRATGVVGFVLLAAVGVFSAVVYIYALTLASSASPTGSGSIPLSFLSTIVSLAVGGIVLSILILTYVILEIITLFSAAGIFRTRALFYAAVGRIVSYVAAIALYVIWFVLLFSSVLSQFPLNGTSPVQQQPNPQLPAQFGQSLPSLVAIPLVLAVPNFIAFLGFRNIRQEVPQAVPGQAPAATVQP